MAMNRTVSLNSKAVELMRRGAYESGIGVLRCSIRDLLSKLDEYHAEEYEAKLEKERGACMVVDTVVMGNSFEKRHTNLEGTCIFDQAIIFSSGEVSNRYVAVVCIYNMALSYHLLALHGAKSERKYFSCARRCYNMARDIFDPDMSVGLDIFLLTAIANNLAHVDYATFQREGAARSVERLQALLAGPARGFSGPLLAAFVDFHLNALAFRTAPVQAAATA